MLDIVRKGEVMEQKEKLYKMKEACKILGVHPNTIRLWDKQGKIKVVRPQGGQRRIPESEINRLIRGPSAVSPPQPPIIPKDEGLPSFLNYVFSHQRDDWELVRKAVIIRDNYTCQECGGKELLEVHHKDGTSRNDPDNLVTLCQKCYNLVHKSTLKVPTPQPSTKPETPAPKLEKPAIKIQPPPVLEVAELPRHKILDDLKPTGLAQRTLFGELLSAATVLKNFKLGDLAARVHCPEAVAKTFCERMSSCGYLVSKNGEFEIHVRLAR